MLKRYPRIPRRLSSVRIRQLQFLAQLADAGSISEAARQFHITQPTATEMLKELERGFDVPLFIRDSKGITLTAQGEYIARRVELSLREIQGAVEESSLIHTRQEILKLGFIPNALFAGLPEAAASFAAQYPDIALNLREFNVPECAAALIQGEIDAAFTLNHPLFVARAGSEEINVHRLHDDQLVACMSSLLRPARSQTLDAQALAALPWILPAHESFIRQVFDSWFIQNGAAPPRAVIEITPITLSVEFLKLNHPGF